MKDKNYTQRRQNKTYRNNMRHGGDEVDAQGDKSVQQHGVGLTHGKRAAERGAQVSVVAGVDDLLEQLRGGERLDSGEQTVFATADKTVDKKLENTGEK